MEELKKQFLEFEERCKAERGANEKRYRAEKEVDEKCRRTGKEADEKRRKAETEAEKQADDERCRPEILETFQEIHNISQSEN